MKTALAVPVSGSVTGANLLACLPAIRAELARN
jgi:hypothetical protein